VSSKRFEAWAKKFSKTGVTSPVQLGTSRDELRRLLGKPDDVSVATGPDGEPTMLKYGRLEFHFCDGVLWTIFMDTPGNIVEVCIHRMSPGKLIGAKSRLR